MFPGSGWLHILPQRAALPALLREGTALTAGRTKGEPRKLLGRNKRVGKTRGSTVRREKTPSFCSCWICHRIGAEMSTSRQLSESRAIPTRTVLINDTTQLPHDYCTTPGGTLFSTTPGGEHISCFIMCVIKPWGRCFRTCLCAVFFPCSCQCGLDCQAASSAWSKQKQSFAPPPACTGCHLIGWCAAQWFR